MRTPRGRVVTGKTYQHFGLQASNPGAVKNDDI
jgi:Holliday junction DNA helicase RuvB